MKEETKKEISESISELEKIGGNKNSYLKDIISRLKKAIKLEDNEKGKTDGPRTEN